MGQNYFRSLFAVGFQGLLILVCVAIYAVLIQSIAADGDPIGAIWGCVGYTVLLCFTLFKRAALQNPSSAAIKRLRAMLTRSGKEAVCPGVTNRVRTDSRTPAFYGKLPEEFSKADTMRFMVETDLKLSGCVSADTLAALRAEGYDYKDGNLVPAGKEETMQEKVANTTPAAPLKLDVSVRVHRNP